jgi:hypothetical protein
MEMPNTWRDAKMMNWFMGKSAIQATNTEKDGSNTWERDS